MSTLTWVRHWCPDVPFVLKIDDDVIINPFHLKAYLDKQLAEPSGENNNGSNNQPYRRPELRHPATNKIYGVLDTFDPTHRNDKWGLTMEEYPETHLPKFVLGPAYILGGNVIAPLLKYAPFTPFVYLEDVYTTGLVAHAAQVKHVQTLDTLFCIMQCRGGFYSGEKAFWTEHGYQHADDIVSIWMKTVSDSGIKL